MVKLFFSAFLLAGCGQHSKAEVDGLKSALEKAKTELSAKRGELRACRKQQGELHSGVIHHLMLIGRSVQNNGAKIHCWIEASFEQRTASSLKEREDLYSDCLRKNKFRRDRQ